MSAQNSASNQPNDLTPHINANNVEFVREQILRKKSHIPYHATVADAGQVLTDMDHFPYSRYFRGFYATYMPIVMEREAGWRPRYDDCYNVVAKTDGSEESEYSYPNLCFEQSCRSQYPCYPTFVSKYGDKKELNLLMNRSCISQYR